MFAVAQLWNLKIARPPPPWPPAHSPQHRPAVSCQLYRIYLFVYVASGNLSALSLPLSLFQQFASRGERATVRESGRAHTHTHKHRQTVSRNSRSLDLSDSNYLGVCRRRRRRRLRRMPSKTSDRIFIHTHTHMHMCVRVGIYNLNVRAKVCTRLLYLAYLCIFSHAKLHHRQGIFCFDRFTAQVML